MDLKLRDIPGVGASSARELTRHGMSTVAEVAAAQVDDLVMLRGFGENRAADVIAAAARLLTPPPPRRAMALTPSGARSPAKHDTPGESSDAPEEAAPEIVTKEKKKKKSKSKKKNKKNGKKQKYDNGKKKKSDRKNGKKSDKKAKKRSGKKKK